MKHQSFFILLFLLSLISFAQPANDDCSSAENLAISTSQITVNFEIDGANVTNEAICGSASDEYGDIWYEFTMPVSGNLNIYSPLGINEFALYDSCSGNQIQCDDNSRLLVSGLTVGANYKLRVFRPSFLLDYDNSLYFRIRVIETPSNDDCTSAETLNVTTGTQYTLVNIFGASLNNEEGCSGTIQDYLDVWFEFTMPLNGKFVFERDDMISFYALYNDCTGSMIQCNDSGQFSNLIAGETYKLRLINDLSTLYGIVNYSNFSYFAISHPPNDDCNTSENINVSTSFTTIDYDIDGAIIESDASSNCNETIANSADIWYDLTMPVNGSIIIESAFGADNYLELFDACDNTRLICGNNDLFARDLLAGNNYKIRLFRSEDDLFEDFWDQEFDIKAVELGSNDSCSTSETIDVSTTPLEVTANFLESTFNNDAGCIDTNSTNFVDLWYNFSMPLDGYIVINRFDSNNGNYFALYDTCDGTEIGCFSNQGNFPGLTMGTNYTLRVFDNNGFNSDVDFTIEATTDDLSVDEQTLDESISVYPNPANDYINIELTYDQTILAINCYDIFGKKVLKTSQNTQLDLSKLMSGLYFIEIKTDVGSVTKKIIIQ